MKVTSKILGTISALLLVTTGWLLYSGTQSKGHEKKILQDLEYLKLKAEADELFILGNQAPALTRYSFIDSVYGDSLVSKRSALLTSTNDAALNEQVFSLQRQLERATSLLSAYEKQEKGSDMTNPELEELRNNESKLLNEIFTLKEKLNQIQREDKSNVEKKGVLTFTGNRNSSITYFGDLQSGKANGTGFGYWNSGSTYEGNWKENMRHGKGTFLWADGEKYTGDYVNDQREGYGIYTAKAGRYEGQWLNDMRHGEGKLYEPNGKLKVHGVWEKDKLVKTIK